MTITLKPEQEKVVEEALRAGLIGTADEVVDMGVETIRKRLESGMSGTSTSAAGQQMIDSAAERLLGFGEKYHFSLGGVTIKELVNEGRR